MRKKWAVVRLCNPYTTQPLSQLLMSEITTVLLCLQPLLSTSLYRQLTIISEALLMMQGRVTMSGISRWARRGGSYRTIQRFFLSRVFLPKGTNRTNPRKLVAGSRRWVGTQKYRSPSGLLAVSQGLLCETFVFCVFFNVSFLWFHNA